MRLVCLHANTVDALTRLSISVNDLTPSGLWGSQYHLIAVTPEQRDALEVFRVELEDITPAQLVQAAGQDAQASPRPVTAESRAAPQPVTVLGDRPGTPVTPPSAGAVTRETGREQTGAAGAGEAEVPLTQGRDGAVRGGEEAGGAKHEGKPASGPVATKLSPPTSGAAAVLGQKNAGAKSASTPAPAAQPQPSGGRKGQPASGGQGGAQRYGTTRLRISVAGKYTEATVANGKIVVGGRTFDSPDQAAAELTKSRGDWTFWEYYDSADGKWRMLTRDWDTVLKSAAPGGR